MTFHELVEKARSVRGYDESRSISREEMLELVDCARLTPSAANRQPLKYALVHEKDEVSRMLALTRWGGALPERHLPDPGRGPAAFIVILQETEWVRDAAGIQRDVGIAAQTLLLAAAEKGLCGLMIGAFDPAGVKELMKLRYVRCQILRNDHIASVHVGRHILKRETGLSADVIRNDLRQKRQQLGRT